MNPPDAQLIETEVAFISGVAADGTLAARSYWTWDGDSPATFGAADAATKWGPPEAGTGATVSFSFDPASHWSASEQQAFLAGMALWSAVADIGFTQVSGGGDFTLTRGGDGEAHVAFTLGAAGVVGGRELGVERNTVLSIDTSVAGFGPIGLGFGDQGGAPWNTLEHELGHVIGLGHAGAYDEGQAFGSSNGTLDSLAYSIMSYLPQSPSDVGWTRLGTDGISVVDWPTTPMMIDILAAQRLYGPPTSTPLSGGQVFGFHCNIAGPIEPFFDFSKNVLPVVTLWDEGFGNVLDLSGFSAPASVDLSPKTFSSVGGLTNNVAIAAGVHIDEAIGGSGSDNILANTEGDTLIGGGGNDTLTGNLGPDLILGNAGDDLIRGGAGLDTLYGGAGADTISGGGYLSGDLGDDVIHADGRSTASGGAGRDVIYLENSSGSPADAHHVVADTRENLDGDTLHGFGFDDVIHVLNGAVTDGYALNGGDIALGGGLSLTLATPAPVGTFTVAPDPAGGVDLSIEAPPSPPTGFEAHILLVMRTTNMIGGYYFSSVQLGERDEQYGLISNDRYDEVQMVGADWRIQALADTSGDGAGDVIWRNSVSGQFTIWDATPDGRFQPNSYVGPVIDPAWKIAGLGDLDGDGAADLLWRNATTGVFTEWRSTGTGFVENAYVDATVADPQWRVAGVADFDGDGRADLLWRNADTGLFTEWRSTGAGFEPNVYVDGSVPDLNWRLAGTGDFDGDGRADLLWRNEISGMLTTWTSRTGGFEENTSMTTAFGADWRVVTVADVNGDGLADVVLQSDGGNCEVLESNGRGFVAHDAGTLGLGLQPEAFQYGLV